MNHNCGKCEWACVGTKKGHNQLAGNTSCHSLATVLPLWRQVHNHQKASLTEASRVHTAEYTVLSTQCRVRVHTVYFRLKLSKNIFFLNSSLRSGQINHSWTNCQWLMIMSRDKLFGSFAVTLVVSGWWMLSWSVRKVRLPAGSRAWSVELSGGWGYSEQGYRLCKAHLSAAQSPLSNMLPRLEA